MLKTDEDRLICTTMYEQPSRLPKLRTEKLRSQQLYLYMANNCLLLR